jgi:hypothetical protein
VASYIYSAETDSFSETTSNNGASIIAASWSTGAYAYQLQGSASVVITPPLGANTWYIRFMLNLDLGAAGIAQELVMFQVKDSTATVIGAVSCKYDSTAGTWSFRVQATGGTFSAYSSTIATAVALPMQVSYTRGSGSNASITAIANGQSLTSSNGTATTGISTLTFTGVAGNCNYRFSDITVSDAGYPDATGRLIARQFQTGTPTYNGWTKTGAASIDLCWSNTPMSATTSAVANAASQAQTGLVASFSTTQTGHGSGTIGPNDTINCVKIALFGKRGSGSSTTHTLRFRYNAFDYDSPDWTAITTSDLYTEFYANINLLYTGIKGSTTIPLDGTTKSGAQGFSVAAQCSVASVGISMAKNGSPTGTCYAVITTVLGGTPLATSSNTLSLASVATGAQTVYPFTFGAVVLAPGSYFIELRYSSGVAVTTSNYIQLINSSISGTNGWLFNGTSWVQQTFPYGQWNIALNGGLTTALLNASEAGAVQGAATSQLFTVEDVWVIVDYTPFVPTVPVGQVVQVPQAIRRSASY